MRVLPESPAIDKTFDYLVPPELAEDVRVGTLVRIPLHGRRSGGWVVEDSVRPPAGVALKAIAKVTGWGPPVDLVDLAGWAAWRWAGRRAHFLRTASPPGAVRGLPAAAAQDGPERFAAGSVPDPTAAEALGQGRAVLRLPPAADPYPLIVAAAARGPTLVVAAGHTVAGHVVNQLRRAGVPVAAMPREWARAAAGTGVVVGSRAAAWAPVPGLAAVVVLDEHDEALQEEAAPTWHARSVAAERARRASAPCVLVSACPSLEALAWGTLVAPSRAAERAGWPVVEVVDRRREDPVRSDLYSRRLVDLVRSGGRVVCVLNRKGRAKLLACPACGELARCEPCGAAVEQGGAGLACRRCGTERPPICAACGAGRLKVLRLGVTRAREDLERLAGTPVAEVTGDMPAGSVVPDARVVVGTEAVLHRVPRPDAVAFLDFDQELLAPRYRAAEQALGLLARAARLVGTRADGGRILVQTRMPDHDVVEAAVHADPGRFSVAEFAARQALNLPPTSALAELSGEGADVYAESLRGKLGIEVLGPSARGRWLVRAPGHRTLCDVLAATPRPPGRLRVAVDPARV